MNERFIFWYRLTWVVLDKGLLWVVATVVNITGIITYLHPCVVRPGSVIVRALARDSRGCEFNS